MTIPALTGWHELLLDAPVKARFVRVNFGYSSRLYLYEFVLLVGDKIGGFTVTGEQYKYIHGPLLDMKYVIEDVILHPIIDKAIRIEFNDLGRFPTVHGDLTVEYDATIGNLVGQGGAVESFIEAFTPDELKTNAKPRHRRNYYSKSGSSSSGIFKGGVYRRLCNRKYNSGPCISNS